MDAPGLPRCRKILHIYKISLWELGYLLAKSIAYEDGTIRASHSSFGFGALRLQADPFRA
jgi:hypothetical protein